MIITSYNTDFRKYSTDHCEDWEMKVPALTVGRGFRCGKLREPAEKNDSLSDKMLGVGKQTI